MRVVIFCHSLFSDWNHGNAHFLRGITGELLARGNEVAVYEPHNSWSLQNLLSEHGREAIEGFHTAYPQLHSSGYDLDTLDLDAALDGAGLVLVHEWNDHDLVRRIGRHRARVGGYHLLFHDTHHRSVTDAKSMSEYDLSNYDGVLAFGKVIRDLYIENGWAKRAWTWHEAADTRVFKPLRNADDEVRSAKCEVRSGEEGAGKSAIRNPQSAIEGDLVWIGNWGDEERTEELKEFLIKPVKDLRLAARIYGVRYPDNAKHMLRGAGIEYAGWLPNYEVPRVFAGYKVTVHIPRRPYVKALPGIPTIRVFEALACGIPLISAPWEDAENLFTPGSDFLLARDGNEMRRHLKALVEDSGMRREISSRGLRTILARHTCAHRVDELLNVCSELAGAANERTMIA